jgi:hypothetical protein
MSPNRYRMIYTLLGLALAAIVVGAVVFAPSGRETPVPEPIESFFPQPGDIVQRPLAVEVDMKVGYRIELFLDDVPIPAGELDFTEPTGDYEWRPGPGQVIEEWTPGVHNVLVMYDKISGSPDPGRLRWAFRVQ